MAFSLKKFVKAYLRSGDVAFAREIAGAGKPGGLQSLQWKGLSFHYRPGSSDAFAAYECFLHGKRNAYFSRFLPARATVKSIVDIGANVGASIVYWKSLYPEAVIHCFEPIPSNFEVLQRNCAGLRSVTPHNHALGDESGEITFIHSPDAGNEGGWSVFQRGATGNEKKVSIPIFNSGARLAELGVKEIDILKVDTEGAERMILRGLGAELLSSTRYVCGELHGERDFELLDWLEGSGFSIGMRKSPRSSLFNFEAVRTPQGR